MIISGQANNTIARYITERYITGMTGSSGWVYQIAEDDMGFVTTAAARRAGVTPQALVMMARRGVLERVSHGVYRLVRYPVPPHAQLREGTLWPYPVEGVLSHESALVIHELSDVSPSAVHITVPSRYRLRREAPAWLRFSRADLADAARTRVDGVPVTTVARTIHDCISDRIDPALIRQAIDQARERGAIDEHAASELGNELRRPRRGR